MRIVLFGPPGAGKGTVAREVLGDHRSGAYLAMGDHLRAVARSNADHSRAVAEWLATGSLVADSIVISEFLRLWNDGRFADEFVFDGFPRTRVQADHLDLLLHERRLSLDAVVYLRVDDSLVLTRLGGRRVCSSCERTYHVLLRMPRIEGRCDTCGGRLTVRDDDLPDVIIGRLAIYRQHTEPIIGYYERLGQLFVLDGAKAAEDLASQIRSIVDSARRGSGC